MQLAINGGSPVRADRLPIFKLKLNDDDCRAVHNVLQSGQISRGAYPASFEQQLNEYLSPGGQGIHSVVVANGTAALHLALLASKLPPGSEIIVPSLTFVATAFAPIYVDCVPIFADIDPTTGLMDPVDVNRKLTDKTKAIICVDFAGQPSYMDQLLDICKRHSLLLVEDAAHSIGASYDNKKIGTLADLTTFSFFATKNITSGEGGAVTTKHPQLGERLKLLRAHGIQLAPGPRVSGNYDVVELGFNCHLSNLNIALASSQLRRLDQSIEQRRKVASQLSAAILESIPEGSATIPSFTKDNVFHLFYINLCRERLRAERDDILSAMQAEGIDCGVYYRPVHLFRYFLDNFGMSRGRLPHTEHFSDSVLTLPFFPDLTKEDVRDISTALGKVLSFFRK